jgi:uncharacterized protein
MDTGEIYRHQEHRPLPMPDGKWAIYQEWRHVIFLHWQVTPEQIEQFIPAPLEPDTYKGIPWVSVVAFRLENVRPRYLPSFSPVSNSDEINIRTYVKYKGKPGIFFLSMELGSQITNTITKSFTGLPYRHSNMDITEKSYRSLNKESGDALEIEFSIKSRKFEKSELEKWLTERYVLFQDEDENTLMEFEIHHSEWPLHSVHIDRQNINYSRFSHFLRPVHDMAHYSPGVEVLTWAKKTHNR